MKIRQGESIFFDYIKEGENTTDSESATYYIKDSNDEIILTGDLEINENTFMLRITREDTISLQKGNYTLLVAYNDSDDGYMDYIEDENLTVI